MLLHGTGQLICYWGALVLLAAASAYLIHSQFAHPGRCAQPASDPLGIVTPSWLILPVPPLGAVGFLGQAFWQAMRGRRRWKWILAAAAFTGSCSRLANSLEPAHRPPKSAHSPGKSRDAKFLGAL